MAKLWQLGALMKKNLIVMKRNWVSTTCELLFPILLMILLILVRKLIKTEEFSVPKDDTDFLKSNSTALIDQLNLNSEWNGLTIRNPLEICKRRPVIASIGADPLIPIISSKISLFSPNIKFINFNSVNEINAYVADPDYSSSSDKPALCFGFYFVQNNATDFNYSLHYFDELLPGGDQDTPSTLTATFDPFQVGPDMNSYRIWLNSGYLQIMKIINDSILQKITENTNAKINFGMMSQKYSAFKIDIFGLFIGFILPFFLIIAYLSPLCIMVFRMVEEKETRAKEGMKIMGLDETVYFFSFLLQWIILNTLYSIINSLILTIIFSEISFIFILSFFWLFGMCIFAMAYFFQGLMDKTKIAVVVSIIIYFIMYFVSQAVLTDDVSKVTKMLMSLLPPTCLQLGIAVLAKFEASFIKFGVKDLTYDFNNYSVLDMYIMLTVDFFVYLFLGYYFDNVLSHEYGIRRPYNFLCTRAFCFNNRKRVAKGISRISSNDKDSKIDMNRSSIDHNDNFQSEDLYEEQSKSETGNCLQIKNLRKKFDDGKVALDGLNLNLYNQEIFALLGHNGAGKSTTISILCGLYEATGGSAIYNGENILDFENMQNFRQKLGICPQHDVLFQNLTVKEHLDMFCVFKGVLGDKRELEINKILNDVEMMDKSDELAKNLSGGQKRKLSIAIALIGGSQIIFLDEPSSGMDITSRRNLWDILKKCVGNKIIVLTTHYMEEAAVLGNRIGIVSNGKLKCCGNGLFLIDRFGKYLSLNISKRPNANDNDITEFIKLRIPNVEFEILSEEILFRIPKEDKKVNPIKDNFSFKLFFNDLDNNLEKLQINSYGISMPTLEDVFLNVSSDTKNKLILNTSVEQEYKEKDVEFEFTRGEEISCLKKFITDFQCSFKKRFLQIIRDKKSFLLEILGPIVLVLIGLGISSVKFFKDSPIVFAKLDLLPNGETIVLNQYLFNNSTLPISFQDKDNFNVTFDYQNFTNKLNIENTLIDYNNMLSNFNYTYSYGSYYIVNFDKTNHLYEFVAFVNLKSRNAAIIYSQYMMSQILSFATDQQVKVNFSHEPFPLKSKLKQQGETRNTTNLVFFISIAFALIPANFITNIIKERETNSKHLQIISGISLTSYWLSNLIFELIKFLFIGGVNLLIIYAFGNFPYYLWLLTLSYGFAMTTFTYMLSFLFAKEASAQNFIILINFMFGSLGGTIILVFRTLKDLVSIGKTLAYVFRLIPSFAFAYGYNQLLSAPLLFSIDYPTTFPIMAKDIDKYIIKLEYVGADILYLCLEFFIYLFLVIIFESTRNCWNFKKENNSTNILDNNSITDSNVLEEIQKANADVSDKNFSIRIKNLEKKYSAGYFSKKELVAVNKLSFCLEYGECFALLGVNGAGKSTTFKSLTLEHLPTAGEIFINGLEITSNFNKVRNLIGYCPQFDAIFDYMTVYENLDFYARLKGIQSEKVDSTVNYLMKELNLIEYKQKISGKLSGGNKRKLSVGIAMIGNPPIILLDEPSTGMDPEARRFMWAVIHKLTTRRKLSSVILTTHSMEEAETLCRRIGIMVDGQFKCLGTSQAIKDKYGYGFEIDLRIQNMPESILEKIIIEYGWNSNDNVTNINEVVNILRKLGKDNYIKSNYGVVLEKEIIDEISNKGFISIRKIIKWSFYIENALKCISFISNDFEDVKIAEILDNIFKLKLKKNISSSVGYLYGLIEDQKSNCFIGEYSISQTSLEQIFNKFSLEKKEKENITYKKIKHNVSEDILEPLMP